MRLPRIFWLALFLVSLTAGIVLLGSALIPYGSLKAAFDSLAGDGNFERLNPQSYAALRPGLAGGGVIMLLLATVLWLGRRSVIQTFARWQNELPQNLRLWQADAATLPGHLRRAETDRSALISLGMLVILGAGLRLWVISQPMRYDETYTYLVFSARSFAFIVSDYHLPNNHVLHSLLVAISTRLLGDAPWVIRLPALLAGVASIPFAYLAAAKLYNRWAGLLAAAAVAASSFLIEYSTDARGYILIVLFTLKMLALAVYLRQHSNRVGWLLFGSLAALGIYTVPVMLYPAAALWAWLLLSALTDEARRQSRAGLISSLITSGLFAVALTLLLYLPILRTSGVAALAGNRFVAPLTPDVLGGELWGSLITAYRSWVRDVPSPGGLLLLVLFLLSPWLASPIRRGKVPLAPVFIGVTLAVMLAQRVAPWARVWLFMLPVFYIEALAGVVGVAYRLRPTGSDKPGLAGGVVILLVAALLGWNTLRLETIPNSGQTGTLKDAESIVLYLDENYSAGDTVLSIPPSNYPLRYYLLRHHLPESRLYAPRQGTDFSRAWVVVNTFHNQTLPEVIRRQRLEGILDPAAAELVRSFPSADIYRIDPP